MASVAEAQNQPAHGDAVLSTRMSGGVVSISKDKVPEDYCDTFCLDFDGGWRAGIHSRVEFGVSARVGLVAGLRYWLWTRSDEEMFPFDNGVVYSIGIQLH